MMDYSRHTIRLADFPIEDVIEDKNAKAISLMFVSSRYGRTIYVASERGFYWDLLENFHNGDLLIPELTYYLSHEQIHFCLGCDSDDSRRFDNKILSKILWLISMTDLVPDQELDNGILVDWNREKNKLC